ncbi:hypothetical protein [Nocardia farcinica]|uniref:hypothetical protein n=1 Tax=Nocardia farcinica TaxID=37329 RepID=UPI00189518C2|nr:hypothetical protein [Nocardia farcinica]MBF6235035.1 hypothetical protein [Nocardia farcinica]MBF6445312.1 hypothetical protein [Nocardia farcinica]
MPRIARHVRGEGVDRGARLGAGLGGNRLQLVLLGLVARFGGQSGLHVDLREHAEPCANPSGVRATASAKPVLTVVFSPG